MCRADRHFRYVLGDSYSSGAGLTPLVRGAPLACWRSTKNYPHLIAAATGAALTDVTCANATIEHLTTSQYPGLAPQLDALSTHTDLVTVTIGGHNNGTFTNAIAACAAAAAITLGTGNPCQDLYGGYFADQVREQTFPALKQALIDIQARAPHAEVAILGYPWILPQQLVATRKMPIAAGDVAYLHQLQSVLSRVIAKAAAGTGATYVDMARVP